MLSQTALGRCLVLSETVGCALYAGFSVNGEVRESALMRKGGLKPGQSLILTKPLGSGVIFAADMRGQAKGSWVSGGQPILMHAFFRFTQRRHKETAAYLGISNVGHGCTQSTVLICK